MNSPHVLFSGGLDSLVTLAIASVSSSEPPTLVFCDMGFRYTDQERRATKRIAKYFGAKVVEVAIYIPHMRHHTMCDVNTFIYFVEDSDAEARAIDKSFIIPYRNFYLTALALNACAVNGARDLWIGFDYEEKGGSSKDKSPAFVSAFQKLIREGAEAHEMVTLHTPLQGMRKSMIIDAGRDLRVPFEMAWTCYNDMSKPCGVCNSCVDRLKGFAEAGIPDPAEYATEIALRRKLGVKDYADVRRECGIPYEFGKSS